MKRTKQINSEDTNKLMAGIQRALRVEQGALDGRFRTRAIPSKKHYTRKTKHNKYD